MNQIYHKEKVKESKIYLKEKETRDMYKIEKILTTIWTLSYKNYVSLLNMSEVIIYFYIYLCIYVKR